MTPYPTGLVFYIVPVALSVSLLCFLVMHIAPGDPLNLILALTGSKGATCYRPPSRKALDLWVS